MQSTSIAYAAGRLGGDVTSATNLLCPGPGHSSRDRSLSVTFAADGSFVAHSFAGDDFRDCRDYVKARLGLADDVPLPRYDATPCIDVAALADAAKKAADAQAIWARSVPISGTLAEVYLASRGLAYDGPALRFHAGGRAMVALISDAITGEPCGLHRTFLDRDGAKRDRKMLGRAKGGVVRLHDDDSIKWLGVAEGIETALATGFVPVWACLSAGGIAGLPVLPGIEAITVFADGDAAGITAANAVGERWHAAGRDVELVAPTTGDFADRIAA